MSTEQTARALMSRVWALHDLSRAAMPEILGVLARWDPELVADAVAAVEESDGVIVTRVDDGGAAS